MSELSTIPEKAKHIRDVIRYIRRFKNAAVVIYIDDELLDSPLFTSHIRDICLIHEAGLQVLIVPGAKKRIDQVLTDANIPWKTVNNCRITDKSAMDLIKMAAFDVSNRIMTALAGEKLTAVIGNWVRARAKGVINGIDYSTSGEIDKLQDEAIRTVLSNGFIPIFPCIGWSLTGKPYNISSLHLAEQVASHMQADKLFFLIPSAEINDQQFNIPTGIGLSTEHCIPAMNLEELHSFLANNKITEKNKNIISLLKLSEQACLTGVSRVHILNGSIDGTLPCEIFSNLGSGTMIYKSNYGGIRAMKREDIPALLNLIRPFVKKGILLPRSEQNLQEQYQNYIVYELDGAICACAALIPYSDNQMEIAAVAVDESCAHIGIGPKMINYLTEQARFRNAKSVFVLTTQTSDWFEKLGFKNADISTLPDKRKEIWTPKRNSKVLRIEF
ncbi:MAG: amino-acid N-acetyltransferase [Treponema sp.]|nr:amino-acid N-acetyltransferase [Treponema sp.]